MEYYFEIIVLFILGIGAAYYLFRVFKRAKSGCGSVCTGCNNSCSKKINIIKPPKNQIANK